MVVISRLLPFAAMCISTPLSSRDWASSCAAGNDDACIGSDSLAETGEDEAAEHAAAMKTSLLQQQLDLRRMARRAVQNFSVNQSADDGLDVAEAEEDTLDVGVTRKDGPPPPSANGGQPQPLAAPSGSCRSLGCTRDYKPDRRCHCNPDCVRYGSCCHDVSVCTSCQWMGCSRGYVRGLPCQCNNDCGKYGNCCSDYTQKCGPIDYGKLSKPSNGESFTFYMYRAQSDTSYPPENVNLANLAGVLWYVHNEIIPHSCPQRKFDITRILRYKVTMKATQPLLDKGMNFGVRYAFDSGRMTGPCNSDGGEWDRYGYFVGCNVVGEYPNQQWANRAHYPDAIWYSLPGPCPNSPYYDKHDECKAKYPGGSCGSPTGTRDCTYHYEDAGFIVLDDVVGITSEYGSHEAFCNKGCHEDNSKCIQWWDGFSDKEKNAKRVKQAAAAFKRKYPHMPGDGAMPAPKCDFKYHSFYPGGKNCAGH